MATKKPMLVPYEREQQFVLLKDRFEQNNWQKKSDWAFVEKRLLEQPYCLAAIIQMEKTGGEPAVVSINESTGKIWVYDCSPETPNGRRSICYDPDALASRKENKPANSAWGLAKEMGVALLTEQDYRFLQQLGKFDQKTSSWVDTPAEIRKLGGALFCDRRYNHVFVYHNGAESYYAARGFRGKILL